MAYLWLVVIILGVVGYASYSMGFSRDWVNWILRRDSTMTIAKLEEKAKALEEKAAETEKITALKRRIVAAENRIKNARR